MNGTIDTWVNETLMHSVRGPVSLTAGVVLYQRDHRLPFTSAGLIRSVLTASATRTKRLCVLTSCSV